MRQALLPEKRFGRYLFYAIGEIVLVVIGILIALQINNLNTKRLETEELHNYLKNIKHNLEADLVSMEEIKIFRDSSSEYSRNYLRIAKKDKITIDDIASIVNSNFKAIVDQHFKPRTSGFEALKNSGYIGKLNGTILEEKLNEYYYIIDKISEREQSLNHTIENLEIIAFVEGSWLQVFEINNKTKNKEVYFSTHQEEIKKVLNAPSLKGLNFRNRNNTVLLRYYIQIEELANEIISEINYIINRTEY